jgi:hypothetical protein
MADIHWFDRLNKALVRSESRRHAVQTLGALIIGLIAGAVPAAEVGAEQGKDGPQRPEAAKKTKKTCSKGACRKQWPRSRQDQRSCEATCARCKRTKTKLCLVQRDPNDPTKVADCCLKGETCCGHECVDLKTDPRHCGGCKKGCKRDEEVCAAGDCIPIRPTCPPDKYLCDGQHCRNCCDEYDTCSDSTGIHGTVCVNEEYCICPSDTQYCPEQQRCAPEDECCTDAQCPMEDSCATCTVCKFNGIYSRCRPE